jgi:hypothetical protein
MINGLPAHALLVHVVVVLVPLAAVMLVVVAVWPAARRRLSVHTAVVAGLALLSVPITTEAGDWLEHHVPSSPLVRAHTHLGDTMLPWAIALFILAAALAVREMQGARIRATASRVDQPGAARASGLLASTAVAARARRGVAIGGRPFGIVLAAVAVLVAAGSVVTVYRIGDSGARAAWVGHFSEQANPPRTSRRPAQG